ncbi:MAG: flagellar type III secretion system protein FlhB [Rhodocyclaceae bacterium]|nr:flagellar type III secretion system protein FlhB [Rhodocyclaceae bacterium]
MAEESDLERTEEPTPKRLQDARERGQVARSRELTTFAGLLAGGALLLFAGGGLAVALGDLVTRGLRFDRREAFDTQAAVTRLLELNTDAVLGLLPLMTAVLVIVVLASLLLSGWVFSAEPLTPQPSRLNPFTGIARIFSVVGLVELLKSVVKTVFIGAVAFWFLWTHAAEWLQLADGDLGSSVVGGMRRIGEGMLWVVGALALVVLIDVPFQVWNFRKELRMTKEEVRRETRESEGDPQIKARIRQLQRAAARRRMMANVPKATVVITNPQHYAVALRYEGGASAAPRLLAKGIDLIALRIREIAAENDIPILEAPPLARAVYAHTELEQEIPAELYTAVAEVLAWVYALDQQRGDIAPPTGIAVPPGMDPLADGPAAAAPRGARGPRTAGGMAGAQGAGGAGGGSAGMVAGVGGIDA